MDVDIDGAKTHLSHLERVALSEEVTIAEAGKPVAKLVPFGGQNRLLGSAKGEFYRARRLQ